MKSGVVLLWLCLSSYGQQVPAQQTPTPSEPPSSAPPPFEDTRPRQEMQLNSTPSSVVVSGNVKLEGGPAVAEPVTVEAVCGGVVSEVVYTRSRFRVTAGHGFRSSPPPGQPPGGGAVMSCQIRASLSGYQTATVSLDSPSWSGADVGTLVLRRLAGVEGFSYSMTTAMAPKQASSLYGRGLGKRQKGKLVEAVADLEKAVGIYPKYAIAWYELGVTYHQLNRLDDARRAYGEASKSDDRFLRPDLQLAMMSAAERKWPEVEAQTQRIITLNPMEFPQAFLYHAVAKYNLRDPSAAEKSVRRALELDGQHALPRAWLLLGTIQEERGDAAGAAESLRAYLKYAPRASDSAAVQDRLSRLIQRNMAGH